jgi:predicted acetyltransferase
MISGFVDPGEITDGTVCLRFVSYKEAVPEKGWSPWYEFDIVLAGRGAKAGGIVLRAGYTDHIVNCAGHIGYGVDESFRGMRLAARSVNLINVFASRLGMEYLVITCNPNNLASSRTCEIAGYNYEGIVDVPEDDEMYAEGERQMLRFVKRLA